MSRHKLLAFLTVGGFVRELGITRLLAEAYRVRLLHGMITRLAHLLPLNLRPWTYQATV